MEPNKPEMLYQCSQCDKLHDALHDAEDCCQPEVWTVYKCRGCGGIYETETAAADCCATSGEDCPSCRRHHVSPTELSAIAVAGHCTVCNPHYTLDQQLAIEQLHYQATELGHGLRA